MTLFLPCHLFKIVFLVVFLGLVVVGCNPSDQPAAEIPLLETIRNNDSNLIVPRYPLTSGQDSTQYDQFEMWPGKSLELRLRVILFTDIQIWINGNLLPSIASNDPNPLSHPELDSSGYFQLETTTPISNIDSTVFRPVLVVLPLALRQPPVPLPQCSWGNYEMEVHDISANPNLTGQQKDAAMKIAIFRTYTCQIQSFGPPQSVDVVPPNRATMPTSVFNDNDPNTKCPDLDFSVIQYTENPILTDHCLVAHDVTLAGWLALGQPSRGGAQPYQPHGLEDWHYELLLDNDFITRNYSAGTAPLATAIMPGRWYLYGDNILHPKVTIPLTDGSQPNASTFILPNYSGFSVELNAWHQSQHSGPPPSGWVTDPAAPDPNAQEILYWPFPVMHPFGIPSNGPNLQGGDYVIITGRLNQDSSHTHDNPNALTGQCWENHYKGQGGWLEIHPLDSIRRIPTAQRPALHKDAQLVQLCDDGYGTTPTSIDEPLAPSNQPTPPDANSILHYQEIIDTRFTDMATVKQHIVEINPRDPTHLRVAVSLNPGTNGHFKAVYLLWWEESNTPRPTAVPEPITTSYTTIAPPQGSDYGGRHGLFTYNNGSMTPGCKINSIILTLLDQNMVPLISPQPNNVPPGVLAGVNPASFENGTIISPPPSSTDYGSDYTVKVAWNSQSNSGHWEEITYTVTGRGCTSPLGIAVNQP